MGIINSKKSLHGAKVSHFKNTHELESVAIKIPEFVKIPMIQHIGEPCIPLVKKGEQVFVGQKIGESDKAFSAPIHSSCSGIVTEIEEYTTTNNKTCKAVIIKTDGEQKKYDKIVPPIINNKFDFISAIKNSGLVGLGGAGFPTYIKLDYKDIDKVDKLVINAAECEPYITTDYREIFENTQNIVDGISAVQKYLNINQVFIGVEDNKPKAIEKLNEIFNNNPQVEIIKLKTVYPQGAEKAIIYSTTGVIVEAGKLPADCGVIVLNVSTVGFIGRYIKDGIPLVERRITVDGDMVKNPQNLRVPLGTLIKDVLNFCDVNEDCGKVLMGGPMMGIPILQVEMPIIKNNNAIIILSEKASQPMITTACIRCGKCIRTCPMNLMPANFERAYENRDVKLLKKLSINLCIDCGCCTYVCPAKRHLAQKNQLAKILVKTNK